MNKYITAIGLTAILGATGCTYSEGSRTGTVQKFSEKGWMCDTWEGTLTLAGNGLIPGGTWDFTVADEGIVKKVQEAQDAMQPVKLKYEQKKGLWGCSGDTEYFVTDVKYLKTPKATTMGGPGLVVP
tara:strand:- start:44089 stop:44469 length:381 start_codon:yes stop_codon:yes gene_type:complete